jgi:putative transposase
LRWINEGLVTATGWLVRGEILDMLVQRRRDKRTALKLMRKLLTKQGFAPAIIVTDRLRSYAAAFKDLGLRARHEQGLRANNRAENSLLVIRRREQETRRFKPPGSALRFLNLYAAVYNTFTVQRHLISRSTLRTVRAAAMTQWQLVALAARTARSIAVFMARAGLRDSALPSLFLADGSRRLRFDRGQSVFVADALNRYQRRD